MSIQNAESLQIDQNDHLYLRWSNLNHCAPSLLLSITTILSLSLIYGALLSLAWLYPELFYVSLLGHSFIIFYALRHRAFPSLILGTIAGTIALAVAFHWSPASITETTNLEPPWPVVAFVTLIVWEAFIFGLFLIATSIAVQHHRNLIWLAPAWWVALEFCWPRVFTWAIAHTHSHVTPVLQAAEFMGTSGVSAIVILAAITIAKSLECVVDHQPWRQVTCAALVLLTYFAWGSYREQQVANQIANFPTVRIAAIQVDPSFVDAVDKMRARSLRLQKDVDLVLWPESSLGHYHESLGDFCDPIRTSELCESPNPAEDPTEDFTVELLAGGKTYAEGGRDCGPYCNTAFLINPEKSIIGKYVKRTLMPVGEYLPGESLLPAAREWVALDSALVRGTSDAPLIVAGRLKAGTLICYEDMIASNARRSVLAGAEFLVAIINGSGFRDVDTLAQHQRLAMLRAVENRRGMVRCAATGVTCYIAPTGRIEQQLPTDSEGEMVVAVPISTNLTLYTRYGEWFAWFCIAITLLVFSRIRMTTARTSASV